MGFSVRTLCVRFRHKPMLGMARAGVISLRAATTNTYPLSESPALAIACHFWENAYS